MKFILFLILFIPLSILASNNKRDSLTNEYEYEYKLNVKNTIIPLGLLAVGLIGFESDGLKIFNSEVQEEVTEHVDRHVTIDDYLQYAPAGIVYANNLLGIKGRHNFPNQLLIQGTSLFIMGGVVTALKYSTKVERPDRTGSTSFPSGHTAMAFANAEFLWQEYKHVTIWYGIAGYTIASAVGIVRVVNSKHWVTDIMAGAGIGILSTKLSYLIHEKILVRKKNKKQTVLIAPFYNTKQFGLNCSITF